VYIGKYGEKCREQRAESREQRAESSGRCPPGGEKTILQVVWSTDLYLALNHRERHHSSEASLAARWQVTHSRRI
jgi:hypothetical protein